MGDSAFVLVVEGAVHPIGRQCTRSDRVQRSLTGVVLRNGCSASLRVQRFVTGAAPPIGLSPGATRAGELPSVAYDNGYGFPKISHVISLSTFQVLKYGRCNCNVCEAS